VAGGPFYHQVFEVLLAARVRFRACASPSSVASP
jgi:hypothetical protein